MKTNVLESSHSAREKTFKLEIEKIQKDLSDTELLLESIRTERDTVVVDRDINATNLRVKSEEAIKLKIELDDKKSLLCEQSDMINQLQHKVNNDMDKNKNYSEEIKLKEQKLLSISKNIEKRQERLVPIH